jgi:A/G-specific adenine glycosylase
MDKKPCIRALLGRVKRHYKRAGRHTLPWRATRDPYRILVSEVMLQQTQVSRVLPYYKKFIKKYPNARALSRTKLPDVLLLWSGLGYNRRAKYLRDAAKVLATEKYSGQKLPGVGPYTKGALSAFAFNTPEVFIETNIRTVFIHFCFPKRKKISDKILLPHIEEALRRSNMEPREFYYALMDYGSHLKGQGVRLNSRSKHYVKQTKFKGSKRELRGAIVRELLRHHATLSVLLARIPKNREEVSQELTRLIAEGLVKLRGKVFSID